MSLDVYLVGKEYKKKCCCSACDNEHEAVLRERFYDSNITHNLVKMAQEAGIYNELWIPEEIGITKAAQLIEPLTKGLALLKSDRVRFEKYNASNGWGLYENFVPFVEKYLAACQASPDADVRVSR